MRRKLPPGRRTYMPLIIFCVLTAAFAVAVDPQEGWNYLVAAGLLLFAAGGALRWWLELRHALLTGKPTLVLQEDDA